jgi:peptidoglycan/LPS O-acetylase OafA/YrhL
MKLIYRPEIDGLRAIAAISVILYHAQITILGYQPFKGGFIGVDIFFVISGYLITSIILKELENNGSFSFKHFYERRIRRIIPVLLFVMLLSLPFAWMFLLPSDFVEFSKSILYSLGFNSNHYFHYSGQKYDAENSLLIPFLHTWSLSVEEQFYILFPVILIFTFKYFKKYIFYILAFGFVISLILADWGSKNHPSFNFYALPTRGWELLAGSILSYFEIKLGYRSKLKILNFSLPSLGLFLIGYSVLFFNDDMLHPSFYTLLPIIGVCLIIWFSNKDEIITRLLSTKLFVGIGLISYSLYLWHYPIFSFNRIIEFTDNIILRELIIGMLLLILSLLSYYLIEIPFRNKKYLFSKIFKILLLKFFIILFFSISVIKTNGYSNRYPSYFKEALDETKGRLIMEKITKKEIINKNVRLNNLSNSDLNKPEIFILGDSHAEAITVPLWKNYKNNYNINLSLFSGCQFILNITRVNKKTLEPPNNNQPCTNRIQEERLKFVNKSKNSIVILFGRLPLIVEEERFYNSEFGFYEGDMDEFMQNDERSLNSKSERQQNIKINFIKTIQKLSENNHKVILIYPMPEVGIHVPRVLIEKYFKNKYSELFINEKLFTTSFDLYKKRTKTSFEILDSVKAENVYRVYPHKLFCDTIVKDRCLTHDEEDIFYFDDDHPSIKGSEMINNLIIQEIEKIEVKSF